MRHDPVMAKAVLAQVVDPGALDAAQGTQARLRISVPEAWAAAGDDIEITAPLRLACARCDGGGCDGCGRSGAHRSPDDPAARTLRVQLPPLLSDLALRLVRPFGDDAPPEQLLLVIVAAPEPSQGVARVPAAPAPRAARIPPALAVALLAALAAIVAALMAR